MATESTNQLHAASGHMVTIIRLRYASDIVTGARQEEMKLALTMEDAVDAILYSFEDFDLSLEVNPAFTSFDDLDPVPVPSLPAPPFEPHLTTPAPQTASASSSSRFAALRQPWTVHLATCTCLTVTQYYNTVS